jgi:DNA-binding transcriptional regulator GbsR (MarR family)
MLSSHIVHSSMNNMRNQEAKSLRDVARGVGSFIRYWGFRNIHGEIWAMLYLSKKPLSGVELVELLDVSKALVSPGLKELEREGLIFEVKSENAKVKRYAAAEDVGAVIRRVIEKRESKMISEIQNDFRKLKLERSQSLKEFVDSERADSMERMLETAQLGIDFMLGTDHLWK